MVPRRACLGKPPTDSLLDQEFRVIIGEAERKNGRPTDRAIHIQKRHFIQRLRKHPASRRVAGIEQKP